MQRVLTFDGDEAATRFAYCYQALVCSPYLKQNQERDFETKRKESRLHKALKAISEPGVDGSPEADVKYAQFGIPSRRLSVPGPVSIGQDVHELLERYVKQFPWGGGQLVEDAVETAEWLGCAATKNE